MKGDMHGMAARPALGTAATTHDRHRVDRVRVHDGAFPSVSIAASSVGVGVDVAEHVHERTMPARGNATDAAIAVGATVVRTVGDGAAVDGNAPDNARRDQQGTRGKAQDGYQGTCGIQPEFAGIFPARRPVLLAGARGVRSWRPPV